ncbi:hypothetical protein BJ742DRAFT_560292 [Cladochytrium replicatum]|nr:hypothetical protein BJ742DRAFT_560292 [Cladochytrium replicatum]
MRSAAGVGVGRRCGRFFPKAEEAGRPDSRPVPHLQRPFYASMIEILKNNKSWLHETKLAFSDGTQKITATSDFGTAFCGISGDRLSLRTDALLTRLAATRTFSASLHVSVRSLSDAITLTPSPRHPATIWTANIGFFSSIPLQSTLSQVAPIPCGSCQPTYSTTTTKLIPQRTSRVTSSPSPSASFSLITETSWEYSFISLLRKRHLFGGRLHHSVVLRASAVVPSIKSSLLLSL